MAETLTIILSITVCRQAVSHYLLNSSSDRHSSWEDEQNLTMDFYSFHFITSRRAGFRDCESLAVATTLTRSHVALRALCASILQLDKPIIESKVMHTFAYFFILRIFNSFHSCCSTGCIFALRTFWAQPKHRRATLLARLLQTH
jgi:hypothetical protein